MRGFQLWINLPAAQKMTAPEYQEIRPQAIPESTADGVSIRVIAGDFNELHGPVSDPNTGFHFLDVTLAPGHQFTQTLPENHTAFLYIFEGNAGVSEQPLQEQQLAVLDTGERVTVTAGSDSARFLLVAGGAIHEPIVQYGPFVMNTREEIDRALMDYRDGKLVQTRAAMINH